MRKILITCLAICLLSQANAQYKEMLDSKQIIQEAYQMQVDENLDEAYDLYTKIPANDSLYSFGLLFQYSILSEKERYDEALEVCEKGIMLEDKFLMDFYVKKGAALMGQEKYEDAIAFYNESLKTYPKSHRIRYNIAICYKKMEQYERYLEDMKAVLALYPYYGRAHLDLGGFAYQEGKISQAMMSYIMYLLIEPVGEKSNQVLYHLNLMVGQKNVLEPTGTKLSPKGDDFSDIDLIINNYAAMQKGYKVKSKVKLDVVKQTQVMLETMQYDPDDEGFWMQTYGKYLKQIWDEDMFEELSYNLIRSSESPKHKSLVRKKTGDIQRFIQWSGPKIREQFGTIEIMRDGKKVETNRLFHSGDDTGLLGIGEIKGEYRVGYWEMFHPSGAPRSKGTFDDEGNATGEWKVYDENGRLQQAYSASEGQPNGKYRLYDVRENLTNELDYVDGKLTGEFKEFYKTGGVYQVKGFTENELNGKVNFFYRTGALMTEYMVNKGMSEGKYTKYYEGGEVAEVSAYSGGELNGPTEGFYRSGELSWKGNFKDDMRDGEWINYYKNGNLKSKSRYVEGRLIGESVDYFENGSPSEKVVYDEEGKRTGSYFEYDLDGKLYEEFEYKKGNLIAYKQFDKEGNVMREEQKQKGALQFASLYPDGTRRMEGLYSIKGGKDKTWKYYDINGNLEVQEEYEEGLVVQPILEYYTNGALYKEASYEKGEANGAYTLYFRNGQVLREGWMMEGNPVGVWKQYNQHGTLQSVNFYEDGQTEGWQDSFTENGELDYREFYEDDILIKTAYFDPEENPIDTFVNVNANGKMMLKRLNKEHVWLETERVNGQMHGKQKWYFADGKLSNEVNYINGERHGEWKRYHHNGKLSYQATYDHGNLNGRSIWYFRDGQVDTERFYKEDEPVNERKNYFTNGKPRSSRPFEQGKVHGEAKFYNRNGELVHIREYCYDKIVGYSYIGKDNKPVAMIPIKNETALVKNYFSNGKPSCEFEIKSGFFDGKYTRWYQSGQVSYEATYVANQLEGVVKSYHLNGQLHSERESAFDEWHGESKYYDEKGRLIRVERYVNGDGHGKWEYFKADGSLDHVDHYYNGYYLKTE